VLALLLLLLLLVLMKACPTWSQQPQQASVQVKHPAHRLRLLNQTSYNLPSSLAHCCCLPPVAAAAVLAW
jgi:hypothetical protein